MEAELIYQSTTETNTLEEFFQVVRTELVDIEKQKHPALAIILEVEPDGCLKTRLHMTGIPEELAKVLVDILVVGARGSFLEEEDDGA